MTNDITILSCPQCGFPRIRDCGNGLYQCDDCGTHFDKSENIVLTNEEWFCQLPTEEKAEFLKKIIQSCGWCLDGGNPPYCLLSGNKCFFHDGDFVEWLKEIHHEMQKV